MPEQLLNRPEVGTRIEQVRRTRVSHGVWMKVPAPRTKRPISANDVLNLSNGQPRTALGEPERSVIFRLGPCEYRSPFGEVSFERFNSGVAEGNHAFLATLAEDSCGAVREIAVREVHRGNLTDPSSRRVQHLEDCAIPSPKRFRSILLGRGGRYHAERLIDGQEPRKRSRHLGGAEARRWIVLDHPALEKEAKEKYPYLP